LALLIIVLSLFALIVLLLLLPMGICISASFHGRAIFKTRIKYLFALLSWELSTHRTGSERPAGYTADGSTRYGISRVVKAIQVNGFVDRIILLIRHTARRVKVRSLQSDLNVSLGDDYYTGMLAGLLIPAVLYLNQRFDGAILLTPAFEEDLFLEGDISGDLQVRPIHVLAPCLGFALSPEVRQARQIMAGGPCKKS